LSCVPPGFSRACLGDSGNTTREKPHEFFTLRHGTAMKVMGYSLRVGALKTRPRVPSIAGHLYF
jgi:hypothetical protein